MKTIIHERTNKQDKQEIEKNWGYRRDELKTKARMKALNKFKK